MISDPHETKYLNINNQSVPVWIYGDEKNPLIYFIHGYFKGFSEYIGDLPMRYLMKNYCVIAFDLPMFGYLKGMNKDRVEFIAQVIENTSKGRRFVLFGGSYGGLLVLKYTREYPDKVKGIIISGMPYFYGLRKLFRLLRLIPLANRKQIVSVIREFDYLNDENLAKINIPVLLWYSAKDKLSPVSMGIKISEKLPNSKLIINNKYKHGWLLHRIDESGFLKEIERFIKSLK